MGNGMKKIALFLICMMTFCSTVLGDKIAGVWKSMNDDTGKPNCYVAVYPYQGKYYGRIIATCNDDGVIDDTIYAPKGRAPGVVGNPYYAGLDLIWDLTDRGERYKGKIVDPEKGSIYNAEVWVEEGNLIVRGELLFFGRNVTWLPTHKGEFPKTFKMPDVKKFVPVIPEVD
jgi:uncharacterized protein (DUF2147 family)